MISRRKAIRVAGAGLAGAVLGEEVVVAQEGDGLDVVTIKRNGVRVRASECAMATIERPSYEIGLVPGTPDYEAVMSDGCRRFKAGNVVIVTLEVEVQFEDDDSRGSAACRKFLEGIAWGREGTIQRLAPLDVDGDTHQLLDTAVQHQQTSPCDDIQGWASRLADDVKDADD